MALSVYICLLKLAFSTLSHLIDLFQLEIGRLFLSMLIKSNTAVLWLEQAEMIAFGFFLLNKNQFLVNNNNNNNIYFFKSALHKNLNALYNDKVMNNKHKS